MNTSKLALTTILTALAATSLAAQTAFTSPSGFDNKEGSGSAAPWGFAFYADGRYQWVDGELQGNKRTLTGLNLRINYENHSTGTAMGRTFTKMTLTVAESDVSSVTGTFSTNYATSGQQVFNNKFALPSYVGTPIFQPVTWNDISIPFSSSFAFSGSKDLLLDFVMEGGVLTNKATWTGGSYYHQYNLDAHANPNPATMTAKQYPAQAGTCRDSADAQNTAAISYAQGWVYGKTYGGGTSTYSDKLRYYPYAYYMAPSATAIMAITDKGYASGVDIGARCQKLYVNLGGFSILIPRTTDTGGHINAGTLDFIVPYKPIYAGYSIWNQTAWTDSKLNTIALTVAYELTIPKPIEDYFRSTLYWYTANATTGSLVLHNPGYSPIIRYTAK